MYQWSWSLTYRLWESSSGKIPSSVACWFGVKVLRLGNFFINGFHSSINRAPIMCLVLRRGVACAPEFWGAQSHWAIDCRRSLEISNPLLFCRERWGPKRWLAQDYPELVADSWLEARYFYFQFGIFPFDCCWKCLVVVREQFKTIYNEV